VFVPYRRYAPVLKFLTLTLFAYVATAFTVNIPWSAALLAAVWPKPTINTDYFLMVVAVLGTTISPYLFFWQASQEVEEMNQGKLQRPLRDLSRGGHGEIDRIRIDTIVGMIFSNVIAFFIILTTAAVLNAGGITNINSATQAAEALRPLAGQSHVFLIRAGNHRDRHAQALNAEVGERQEAVFSDAIDPDDTVLDFDLAGDIPQPIFVFVELFGNAGDSGARRYWS
jgi:Mn2+/Fe2+ NRAMP family transporter